MKRTKKNQKPVVHPMSAAPTWHSVHLTLSRVAGAVWLLPCVLLAVTALRFLGYTCARVLAFPPFA